MTLEQLVPTLDLCQQLKAAGFPQDTALCWTGMATVTPNDMSRGWSHGGTVIPRYLAGRNDDVAAPTAGELEEWLRVRFPNASITVSFCNGDVPTVNVDIDDYVVGQHEGVGQYRTFVAAYAALVLEVAG